MNVRLAGSFGASFISRTRTPSVLRIFGECRRHSGSISPRRTWTQQDIDELFKLREEGKDIRSIALLIGRTPSAVAARFSDGRRVGERASRQKYWSQDETKLLHDLKAEGRSNTLVAAALGRSVRSIKRKLERDTRSHQPPGSTLGQPWTKDEIASLRRMRVQGLPDNEISSALGRTIRAVEWARRRYSSSEPSGSGDWSQDERDSLYRLKAAGLSWREIARQFPSRSMMALRACYERKPSVATARIKWTTWSPDELETLHTLRGKGVSERDISEKLQRSLSSIRKHLWSSAIKRKPKAIPWTSHDITRLVALKSQSKQWIEIAALLGRTWTACRSKYQILSDEQREQPPKS